MKDTSKHRITITGTEPLLLSNVRLADPMDQYARELKKVTGKRTKTDADHEAIAKIMWMGGWYMDESGPYLPQENFHGSLMEGASRIRKKTAVKSGVLVLADAALVYHGPRDLESLWEIADFRDTRAVRRGGKTAVMATRPRIPAGWMASFDVEIFEDIVSTDTVEEILRYAGQAGIGSYRPRFGRFVATMEPID